MAIEKKRMQQRYGSYAEFIAEKGRYLVGELQTVRTGDPNSGTGRGLYMAFEPGVAEQLMTYENGKKLVDEATEEIKSQFTSGVEEAISNAKSATESANLASQNAEDAAEDATAAAQRAENISNSIESAVQGTLINDDSPSETTTFSGKYIDDDFLKKNGDASDATVTFQQAVERANVESGDTLDIAFGKLAKFCADLKTHAFSDPVNNLVGTDPSLPLAAPQGKALNERINVIRDYIYGFYSTETSISLKTFCDQIFKFSNSGQYFAIPFKFRAAADWSPNSVNNWVRGMIFLQNANYSYTDIGQMLACMGNDAYIGNITNPNSAGTPAINWVKIT